MDRPQSTDTDELIDKKDHLPMLEDWENERNNHKAAGDEAYRAGDYETAIHQYTLALSLDPDHTTLLSNRSAAYLQRSEKSKALADAKRCVELDKFFVKGYLRWASAAKSLKRWGEAQSIYDKLIENNPLEKNNPAVLRGIEECKSSEKLEKEREREAMAQLLRQQPSHEKVPSPTKPDIVDDTTSHDILDDFFSEVDHVEKKEDLPRNKKKFQVSDDATQSRNSISDETEKGTIIDTVQSKQRQSHVQMQLSDLGTAEFQISRLLCANHAWLNLNPFRVLGITDPHSSMDVISRRYKALSLLLHPDKIIFSTSADQTNEQFQNMKNQALLAFNYVKEAMESLKDENKLRHVRSLMDRGMKNGKREYDKSLESSTYNNNNNNDKGLSPSQEYQQGLQEYQNKTIAKMFAQIEQERREAERRKTNNEQREREQEDREVKKIKKEMEFDKRWSEDTRMENRMGNWRDFNHGTGRNR